jgi:surface polysaccharide O-acyltransferase-like enzyme
MTDYLSKKIKALSLGAVILVVFLHSYNGELKLTSIDVPGDQSYLVLLFENFLSKGIARIAVPLFFLISGFLFYTSYDFTLGGVADKYKRRLRSLFIPYLFWSVFGLVLFLVLQAIPWLRNFFTKELIVNYSFSRLLFTLLLDPVPYQLWFVRDLIMLVLVSPVIWYLTRSIREVFLVLLLFLWIVAPKTFELFSNEALFFFTLGCAFATDKTQLVNQRLPEYAGYYLYFLWLTLVFFTTYLLTFEEATFMLTLLNNLGILVGILAVWSLYDQIDQSLITKYSVLFGYSFFIFVFHEPLLTVLKKGLFFLLGRTNFSSLAIYVIAPLMTIALSMFLRYVLRKHTPRFYNFTTGGR